MGGFMHVYCKETKSYCEAWKCHSSSGKETTFIEQESLAGFLSDHSGKIIEVAYDDVLTELLVDLVLHIEKDYTKGYRLLIKC